jgi:hypothetical protein
VTEAQRIGAIGQLAFEFLHARSERFERERLLRRWRRGLREGRGAGEQQGNRQQVTLHGRHSFKTTQGRPPAVWSAGWGKAGSR